MELRTDLAISSSAAQRSPAGSPRMGAIQRVKHSEIERIEQWPCSARNFMKLFLLCFLVTATAYADTICGQKASTPETESIEIACLDWPKLSAFFPVPTGTPAQTQVLIFPKFGDAVRVNLAGVVKFVDVAKDSGGRLVARVDFAGIEFVKMPEVKVLSSGQCR